MSFNDLTPPPTLRDRAWQLSYRLGFWVMRAWWRWRRPEHEGALIAVYLGSSLLMLRCSYRAEWSFPGGGVQPGESPLEAARRELQEEIGLAPSGFGPAQELCGLWDGRIDRVHVFPMQLDDRPTLRMDNREIVAARFFTPAELPHLAVIGPVEAYLRAMARAEPADAVRRNHHNAL